MGADGVISWTIGDVWELTALGQYHLVIFALLVPFLAFRSRQKLAAASLPDLDRMKHFRATAVMLILFGALSILTAVDQGLALFPSELMPVLVMLPAGVVMYVVAVAFMRPRWRSAVLKGNRFVQLFMPETPAERGWWLAVSVLAGLSEEITWRGVQTALLVPLVGSPVVAVLLAAVMFGAAHLAQGWKSAGIISLFALGFHGLVWLSGSLYLAMLVHMAYDMTAGLTYARFGRELKGAGLFSTDPANSVSGLP